MKVKATANYSSVFKNSKTVIGMVHFDPLLGYDRSFDMGHVLKDAVADLDALIGGGADAIMVENNYDTPHQIIVSAETTACMTYLAGEIRKRTTLPLGISVLFNDYKAALAIAKVTGASFVRIPVFVDHVQTNYGEIACDPESVLKYRSDIGARNVLILTDIHVKHSKILNKETIEESAINAIKHGADAVIVTGKWTGDMPELSELARVKQAVGDFPLLVGSGADSDNASQLAKYANGVIVSTSIKKGKKDFSEVNMKSHLLRIDSARAAEFVHAFKGTDQQHSGNIKDRYE